MNEKNNADQNLVEHYSHLHDLKSDFRNFNLFRLVTKLVNKPNVVDIGSGLGLFAKMLSDSGKLVVCIEPSQGMRELAAKINPDLAILAGSAEQVDELIKEKTDAVTMIDVLEHIDEDDEQVRKVYQTLNSGGEFIFVVPAHPYLYGVRDRNIGHYRRYSSSSINNLLLKHGFKIKYLRHWNALGFFPYLLSEKIFHQPLESKLRRKDKLNFLQLSIQKILNLWFKLVENNVDFGFGLSIIGVASKQK